MATNTNVTQLKIVRGPNMNDLCDLFIGKVQGELIFRANIHQPIDPKLSDLLEDWGIDGQIKPSKLPLVVKKIKEMKRIDIKNSDKILFNFKMVITTPFSPTAHDIVIEGYDPQIREAMVTLDVIG